jgi:hypothetical protein
MNQSILVIGAVVVGVVVLAFIVWSLLRQRRTQSLAKHFGPASDHTVAALGKRTEAEKELEARARRVEKLHIHALPVPERDRFLELWRTAQAHFVDSPLTAVAEADRLVAEVMRARGYPMADFEQRAADISVDHPQLVEHYRLAHAAAVDAEGDKADTEALRQALVRYRALFEELLAVPEAELEPATR